MNQTDKVFYTLVAIFSSCSIEMAGQVQKVISGTVTELLGEAAEPPVGANVNLVSNQNRSLGGGITNLNGQYNVKVPEGEKDLTIVYSYIEMKTKRIKYTGQILFNVTLESESVAVDEIVVSAHRLNRDGLGISDKEMVSATQKADMEKLIAAVPVVSIEKALQGQLGSVDIVLGGDPGSRSAIRIRGTSTLDASSGLLTVIDGVPYPAEVSDDFNLSIATEEDLGVPSNISPNDIALVKVLKDVSATAIWGIQGANGVLVIKTKQGMVGKTRFSFFPKWTMKEDSNTTPMLNGKEYTSLMQESIQSSVKYIGLNNSGDKYLNMLLDVPIIGDNPDWRYYDEYSQDINWLDYVCQKTLVSDNSFSMNGGGGKVTYRFSLGYMSDTGTTIGTPMNRLNTSMATNYQFSNKLKFGADFSYSQTDMDANWTNIIRSEALSKMPNESPFTVNDLTGALADEYFTYHDPNSEGSFNGKSNYNPAAMAHEVINRTVQREGKITFRVDYEILPGFYYKGWASINMRVIKVRRFLPQVVTEVEQVNKYANQSADAYSDQLALQTENKLMHIKNWNDKHNTIANVLVRTDQYINSGYNSEIYGNTSSDFFDPVVGITISDMNSSEPETRNVFLVGALNYTLLNRYVIHGSLNIEGNPVMGRNERVGYPPAVGLAWNSQNELLPEKARDKWLDEAKFCLSVGWSGRAPSGASVYLDAYVKGTDYMNISATKQARMQLDNLKWETSTEYNYGLDISVLKGRLRFTFDYYYKTVKDLLQKNYKLPSTTSFGSISYFNSGKMKNKGWEFRTDAVIFENKDWRINSYVDFSRNENKITELPTNMVQENHSPKNGAYAARAEVGCPIGSFYGCRYRGVYQNIDATYARDVEGDVMNDAKGRPIVTKNLTVTCQPGDVMYEDINHDGVINQHDIVYLGNANPTLTGGVGLTVKYRQFSINTFFHGCFGQSVANTARMNNESMHGNANQSMAVLRRWKNEGDIIDIPRALYGEGFNYSGSDRFVEDTSFLCLKQLILNCALPKSICNKLGTISLTCFTTGYNLFTWSSYISQDLEVNLPLRPTDLVMNGATTPVSRRYAFGFNLSF